MDYEPEHQRGHAHLPEELLEKILEAVPRTVDKMNQMFDVQEEPLKRAITHLRDRGMLGEVSTSEYTTSVFAVDGGVVIERMTGSDLILAVAVGVEGLTEDSTATWGPDRNQYYQWQSVLPHEEATPRLAQGAMFLMELSVLAQTQHEIRIMDGTHFTPILKINSMLSAKEDNAGPEYVRALRSFLSETYDKIIPDIPDIITAAFGNQSIIALAKYSSSRDVLDAYYPSSDVTVDDKTFFSLTLKENEYVIPLSVGQSKGERGRIWDDLHINCNLDIPDRGELNSALQRAVDPLTTKGKPSELYFTYFKPYEDGPAYRIELKKGVALDRELLEKTLVSLKRQIVFPEIREPYPQYLVDLMAKSVASGLYAIQEGIMLSPMLRIDQGRFNLIFNYRTK
ncbi:MAG: DNA double-strand break repair nuclease NurA [candidate division Zixibacteria bacterium]|nr:DNA double-strand break repair nuclease NurA [candidate division Zixibacteria bacterium]